MAKPKPPTSITPEHSLLSRQQAIRTGAIYYFLNKPCKEAHIDLRFVSSCGCKTCGRIKSRSYGRRNIRRIIDNFNKRTYGIDEKFIDELTLKQNNQCAICSNKFKPLKDKHLDHDHKTGNIRALLCSNCNTGLGLFKDNKKLLELAIQYLNRFENGS